MHPQAPICVQHIAEPPKHCGQRPCIGQELDCDPLPDPDPDPEADPEPDPPPHELLPHVCPISVQSSQARADLPQIVSSVPSRHVPLLSQHPVQVPPSPLHVPVAPPPPFEPLELELPQATAMRGTAVHQGNRIVPLAPTPANVRILR